MLSYTVFLFVKERIIKYEYAISMFDLFTSKYSKLQFLSPARRERRILVRPGFCSAFGVTFSCGRRNYCLFFWNFNLTFLATWGCASDFSNMLPKFKIAARGQLQKNLWAQKLKVRNYSNFTITFPTIWKCAGDIFKVLLKFKMAATDQLQFFGGCKNSKN